MTARQIELSRGSMELTMEGGWSVVPWPGTTRSDMSALLEPKWLTVAGRQRAGRHRSNWRPEGSDC